MTSKSSLFWNNQWSELAINNSPDPVFWIDSDGNILRVNQGFSNVMGYGEQKIDSLFIFDLDENLSKKGWKDIWEIIIKSGQKLVETTISNVNGREIYVSLRFVLVEGDTDKACVFVSDRSARHELDRKVKEADRLLEQMDQKNDNSANDIAIALIEKKEALKKLQDLQRHHETILQSAGSGIYGLNTEGHTTFANEAAIEMVGWTLEELIGKSQHELIHHTKRNGAKYLKTSCPIYAAFKDGKVHHVEDEIFWRKDGSSFPVDYTSTPMWDDDYQLIGAVVSFKDISRRTEAEAAARHANNELKKVLSELEKLKNRLEHENTYLQSEIKLTHNFEEIISQSKEFKKVLSKVEQVAKTDATVLILGESGTGKELIARALHNIGNRNKRPMVKVNCAALPASLIESELFGHEKGAFTGALSKKIGRFELADGGTIFLDEIGEIPIELQPKLLRVLQEGEFERLGSTTTLKVHARVIAATNVDLPKSIKDGTFREDLYYRLNVFPIQIPSLRERMEDIPLLTRHFMMKYNARFSKNVDVLTEGTIRTLNSYSWPGNIRELENVVERGVIVSNTNKLDLGGVIPKPIVDGINTNDLTLAENERRHILKVLESTHWRISGEKGAAKILDIKRTTLEARMKKLGIKRPE